MKSLVFEEVSFFHPLTVEEDLGQATRPIRFANEDKQNLAGHHAVCRKNNIWSVLGFPNFSRTGCKWHESICLQDSVPNVAASCLNVAAPMILGNPNVSESNADSRHGEKQ